MINESAVNWPAMARRHGAFLVVFFCLGALYFSTIRPGQDWGGDFSIYVMEARNFAEHRAFDQSSYVPTADSVLNHPAVYPPLTSLILAPVYAAKGLDYPAFETVLTIFLWLSLPLYYAVACRRGLHPWVAASVVLVFGLSPLVVNIKDSVGSDSVFIFCAAAVFWFLQIVYVRGWDGRRPFLAGALTAVLLILCYLARVTGLAVIGAFAIYELWRWVRVRSDSRGGESNWRYGFTAILLTGAVIVVYNKFAFNVGQHYGNQFPFIPGLYVVNTMYYLKSPALLWANSPSLVRYFLTLALVASAAAGFVRRLRNPTVIEPYVILSALVLITYTVATNSRYELPILPFVMMYGVEGFAWLARRFALPGTPRKVALASCGFATILASGPNLSAIETGRGDEGVSKGSFLQVCSFLKREVPANGLILSWNPRVFALYTDKPSALYPQTADPGEFEKRIPWHGPEYLVYYNQELDRQKLTPYLEKTHSPLQKLFQNADFQVYALSSHP